MKSKIVTFTGKVFDLLDPKPETVCIEDIAHALSNLCRYTGHVRKFYSVGEHSILMTLSDKCPGDPMSKLLHDSAEAYIGDIASPWKALLRVDSGRSYYETAKVYETRILSVISEALGIPINITAEVKQSDKILFVTEIRDLMLDMGDFDWGMGDLPEPLAKKVPCWKPSYAEQHFLNIYSYIRALEGI